MCITELPEHNTDLAVHLAADPLNLPCHWPTLTRHPHFRVAIDINKSTDVTGSQHPSGKAIDDYRSDSKEGFLCPIGRGSPRWRAKLRNHGRQDVFSWRHRCQDMTKWRAGPHNTGPSAARCKAKYVSGIATLQPAKEHSSFVLHAGALTHMENRDLDLHIPARRFISAAVTMLCGSATDGSSCRHLSHAA